jgi:hypothetical protein
MIRVICMVCGKCYKTKYDGRPEIRDSHGYCPECFPAVRAKVDAMCDDMDRRKMEVTR